ncbi:MAG: AmmeMemoRadiSam system protein B [Deltaproteobacteria bacterium]|nr:AmmeMemoRadiSam system protein B [Deltaproteobacteria bacterium]
MDYPKLRNVEIFPVQMEGKKLICFRDPLRITEKMVFLPQGALFIVSLFDGTHSIRDIQAEYMRKFGNLIYSDQIIEVAENLDRYYLLEGDRFRAYRKKIEDDFLKSPVRKPILAGNSYEADPEKLRAQLEDLFTQDGGPGKGPQPRNTPDGLRGFVAPHIDFMRGGPCYAWAYKEVAENSDQEIFILLGTSHMETRKYFVLTKKNFETPFGILPTDQDILTRLEKDLGRDFFTDEFIHRNEHSLEFQAVYLHYLFEKKQNIRIVPILCGPFHKVINERTHPNEVEQINVFIEALRKTITEDERSICLIAGADLAHVGRQFGDSFLVSSAVMEDIREKDLKMLDYVVKGDAEGFFEYILKENDRRNICGLPPIYTLLRLLKNGKGKLLNYSQWKDPDGNGAVTFASLAFY